MGVGFGFQVFGVLFDEEAVFGGKEFDEFDLGVGVEEDVDGSAAIAVEAGLVGEDGYVVGVEGFEGGEVGLFEDVDAGEGGWVCRVTVFRR